jgi:hypothetical protein
MIERVRKRLSKKAKRRNGGHPAATIAFYGLNDTLTTKVAVAIKERR